jgi:predicted permease
VLPPRFDIEDASVDVWAPLGIDPNDHVNRRGNHFLNLVARLRDGVTMERVQADLDRMEARSTELYGEGHPLNAELHPVVATSFVDDTLGDVRTEMWLLFGSVLLVLLIACANVANLLLARAESRSKEMAVRVAMGAGRTRLVRQLLTEGMTLSLVGGALGVVVGHYALRALLGVNPDGVPRVDEIGLDGSVVLFTAGLAVLTGLVFGMAPLLGTTLSRVSGTLREAGARTTRGTGAVRARRVLIVGEVAVAVVLLVGSALLLRSMSELRRVDVGFDIEDLLTMEVSLPQSDYPEFADVGQFYSTALDRMRALPGVVSATAMSGLPPLRSLNANDTDFDGLVPTPDGPTHNVDYWTAVDSDYAETLGLEVLEGRGFEPADALAETPVMLVNERLARTFYPDGNAVGQRIRPPGEGPWFTVVGVVEDMKQAGVANEAGTELFFYSPQITQAGAFAYRTQSFLVRTAADPLALAGPVTSILAELDPTLAVADVQSMEQNMAASLAQPRFMTLLLTLFAAVALALAGIGTYGVMSYSVAERQREIGIRLAMGAERRSVLGMVLGQGGGLAATGIAIGLTGAFLVTRLLESQLYEVSAVDPQAFVVAPLFLVLMALTACWIPARRATSVDPVRALRED